MRDYDEAIAWFTGKLGFTLVEDRYQPEQDKHGAIARRDDSPAGSEIATAKRWVVVAPPGSSGTSLLLARAATLAQAAFIGDQAGGRVFLFLETDDFDRDYRAMRAAGIAFVREPKSAPYGKVAVFADLYGNLWDLVEFASRP